MNTMNTKKNTDHLLKMSLSATVAVALITFLCVNATHALAQEPKISFLPDNAIHLRHAANPFFVMLNKTMLPIEGTSNLVFTRGHQIQTDSEFQQALAAHQATCLIYAKKGMYRPDYNPYQKGAMVDLPDYDGMWRAEEGQAEALWSMFFHDEAKDARSPLERVSCIYLSEPLASYPELATVFGRLVTASYRLNVPADSTNTPAYR